MNQYKDMTGPLEPDSQDAPVQGKDLESTSKRGRPLKYQDPDTLERKIDEYFTHQDECERPYGWNSLAVYLGIDRHTLGGYGEREGYSHLVKRARTRIAAYFEDQLSGKANVTGAIYWLKAFDGMTDSPPVQHHKITVEKIERVILPDVVSEQ